MAFIQAARQRGALLSAIFLAVLPGMLSPQERPQLAFTRVGSRSLEGAAPWSGFCAGPSGRVVVWSTSAGTALLLDRTSTVTLHRPGAGRPVAARFVAPETVQVLEGDSAVVETYSAAGLLRSVRRLSVGAPIVQAVGVESGWFVLIARGRTASGQALAFVAADGAEMRGIPLSGDSTTRALQLSADGEALLLTESRSPFRLARVEQATGDGSFVVARPFAADRPPEELAGLAADSAARWISLPVQPLDRGYVQHLVDLRSDRRILVLRDAHGDVVRLSRQEAALGIVATLPRARRLFAVTAGVADELAEYEWVWSTSPSQGGPR